MKKITGSEAVILSLLEEETTLLFGYVGGAIMPVYDALYDYSNQIKHVLTRHEQGAIHAAQGYARVTGKTGVCFATSGPGATNLITGLADAQLDSTPLVCITGQVSSHFLGSDAFQEQDIISISMPVTKWNYQVTKADEISETISKAFYIANSGRPGPVLIDITKDAQFEMVDFFYKKTERIDSYFPYPIPKNEKIIEAAQLINTSKKPLILAGHGVILSGAYNQVIELAERAEIPVASTLLGLSSLPAKHPLYVGMLGMHGNYGPNKKTNEADVIIAIGMRFDDRVTSDLNRYAKQAQIIHIEIDKSEINKNVQVSVPLEGDAKTVLIELLPLIKPSSHNEWLKEFSECYQYEFNKVIESQIMPKQGKIHMGEVVHILSELTQGKAVVVTDVGQNQMIAARYYQFSNPNSFVTSGGLGTMGFGIPAAIGACMGVPNRDVILVVGDGGFQMTLQELATYSQHKLPIKIIILNNNFLGMVRQWQEMFFNKRYSYTEMTNPDFVTIAIGYGINAVKVSDRNDLKNALQMMLNSKQSFLLDIEVEQETNVLPMIASGDSISNIKFE